MLVCYIALLVFDIYLFVCMYVFWCFLSFTNLFDVRGTTIVCLCCVIVLFIVHAAGSAEERSGSPGQRGAFARGHEISVNDIVTCELYINIYWKQIVLCA